VYYTTTKEHPGRQVPKLTSTRTHKNLGRQVPRPTCTQPASTNQHHRFSYIGNEHLTSNKETNPNKWRSHRLTKKRLHVLPLIHSAKQQSYPMQKRLHIFPRTHNAEQQSYPIQKRLHVFPLTHSAEQESYLM